MKTSVILICVFLIVVLVAYSAAAGMEKNSLEETSLAEDDFAIYLPLVVFEYQSGRNQAPYIPANPAPSDGDIIHGVDVDLNWIGGDPDGDSVTYDVYLEAEDSSPDNLICNDISNTSCDLSALQLNEAYYWYVVAQDEHGAITSGPVWIFVTENRVPNTPSNPSPGDGAPDQGVDPNLSWGGGDPEGDSVTYDVYFSDEGAPETLICNDISGTSCDPGTLEKSTKYYWQVVASDEYGASRSGPVWTFTTELSPNVQKFVGDWENIDANTRGITHVKIRLENYKIYVHMWGKCHPADCDWGEESTPASDANDGILSLTWNPSFAIKTQELSIMPDSKMEVWTFTHFTDGSGREDYERWDYFSKQSPQDCVPELLSPAEGAILDNGRTDHQDKVIWDFDWSSCPDAEAYQLHVINTDEVFPIINNSTISNSAYHYESFSYIPDVNLLGWGWKVRSLGEGGWGPWSAVRSFDVEPVNSDPEMEMPDLIVTSLWIDDITSNSIHYSYTIKNVGTAPANLDGPTDADYDNVSVQAFLSDDTVFNNSGDVAAGGRILGMSPLGYLFPGETFSGSGACGTSVNPLSMNYLILKVDWGEVVYESNENNNTLAISTTP